MENFDINRLERFTSPKAKLSAKASVRSNGAIGISQGTLLKAGISDNSWFAILYYDRVAEIVAIKPTKSKEEPGASKIVFNERQESKRKIFSAYISARSFLNNYSIPFNKTTSYVAEWNKEHKLITFSLAKNQNPVTKDSTT